MTKKSIVFPGPPSDPMMFDHDLPLQDMDGILRVIPEGLARQDKIISMIINDLRSPLGAMTGLLNILLRDPKQSLQPDQTVLAQQVLAIAKGLMRTSERLFHFYGARTFGLTPSSRFIDARQLGQAACKEVQPLAQWHRVTLVNEIPESMRLYVDPTLLHEVLLELLINAIRASSPKGQVTLFAGSRKGMDTLSVQDTGNGIPESILAKMFTDEAVVSEKSTVEDSNIQGIGLGLPLASRIVLAHGGTLEANSVTGQGSVLTIGLPVVRPRILVVDDQKMDLNLLTLYLAPLNVEVVQASSGPMAIVALANWVRDVRRGDGFDLILTDINMPNMDGFTLLEQIMADPNTATIPVILLTGEESMAQRVKGFRMGAADFVLKPVQAEEFRLSVRRVLGCVSDS